MEIRHAKRICGMTLMELMIVLVIISVLVTLAYPSYVDYIRKSRRGEAQQLLLNWSVNQEIFRTNNPQYATVVQLPAPTHDDYVFTLPNRTANTYLLQADAQDDQANDKTRAGDSCATLTINQAGAKGTEAACWD